MHVYMYMHGVIDFAGPLCLSLHSLIATLACVCSARMFLNGMFSVINEGHWLAPGGLVMQ